MESENFHRIFTGLASSLKSHFIAVVLACTGLILIGYGLISSFMPSSSREDIVFEANKNFDETAKEGASAKGTLVVDVSGGVSRPGVYRLSENARVEAAITAAGGFSDDADMDWTQHSLNLAAKLSDGMKLYVPRVGEQGITTHSSTVGGSGGVVAGASTQALVSINSASASELEALPGIGPVTAGKIIDNRPYGSIDELVSKKALGKSVFEKITDQISL